MSMTEDVETVAREAAALVLAEASGHPVAEWRAVMFAAGAAGMTAEQVLRTKVRSPALLATLLATGIRNAEALRAPFDHVGTPPRVRPGQVRRVAEGRTDAET